MHVVRKVKIDYYKGELSYMPERHDTRLSFVLYLKQGQMRYEKRE